MAYNLRGLFRKVEIRLAANPGMTLAKLARHLSVDRHTLERAVRLYRKVSFRAYKQGMVLEKAGDLLARSPNISCNAIAQNLGYRSAASFSRFVKARTGKTLTQMRKDGARG